MIKTKTSVPVETLNKRNSESKIVYAKILEIRIIDQRYVITIEEFVYDEIEYLDSKNNPKISKEKRRIVTVPRIRTKEQVLGLIEILKNEAQLTAYGLTEYIGVYETLNQVERNDFVAKAAHLIENNRDQIRGVNWVKHNETA